MNRTGGKLAFEVVRFTATPASPDVAVLGLEGRFRARVRRRLGTPRLLAENAEERMEVAATDARDAMADADGAHWRATFALPLRLLGGGEFALAIGPELVDLPAPDLDEGADGVSDLHVRLAREANALRALADEARAAAAGALARADSERGQRERLEVELGGERHAREELATRLSQFETELAARDEALERAREEHARELAERDAAAQARADERVAAVEAEAAELRRALKAARADIELLRRERDRAAGRVAALGAAEPATTPLTAAPAAHPEQEAAAPALPLPEGEDVGLPRPVTPAGGANGDGARARGRDEPDTLVAPRPGAPEASPAQDEAPDGGAAGEPWPDDDVEGVRVLGRRPPRSRSGDEPPVEPLPGTAAIGARHIVAGDIARGGLGVWLARVAALLALAGVIAAVLLVVLGMR